MLFSLPAVADIAQYQLIKGITMSKTSSDDSSAIKRAVESTLSGPEDRTTVRLKVEFLKCNLGAVLDLSLGGVRVRSRRALRGGHMVKLYNSDTSVLLKAEVRRCDRIGLGNYEVGLEFIDVSPNVAENLRMLATQATA